MDEATIKETDTGRVVEGPGWFILNVAEMSWDKHAELGSWCTFEANDMPNEQIGIGIHVLEPGQPNGRYHSESDYEGFLVLDGECIAIVEGEERRLRPWDYLHCPPGTHHIRVGAGNGPCAILMVGARTRGKTLHYPVDPVAQRYGASVSHETTSPEEAYADVPREFARVRAPWPPRD